MPGICLLVGTLGSWQALSFLKKLSHQHSPWVPYPTYAPFSKMLRERDGCCLVFGIDALAGVKQTTRRVTPPVVGSVCTEQTPTALVSGTAVSLAPVS